MPSVKSVSEPCTPDSVDWDKDDTAKSEFVSIGSRDRPLIG